ncbi:regulatory helix-turn-helix protein, lysR family [Ensifer sp. OV372]|nr:regulatory helix-turn-helix protein, lysR family [Ensifer sp. OV372]
MDLSWDFYRTFLAVLKEGSLSAAARELGLTQPTVGRHVDAMEATLGYPLFVRSPHGLLPTDAALALKPYAETLAATSAALLRAASGRRDTVSGTCAYQR